MCRRWVNVFAPAMSLGKASGVQEACRYWRGTVDLSSARLGWLLHWQSWVLFQQPRWALWHLYDQMHHNVLWLKVCEWIVIKLAERRSWKWNFWCLHMPQTLCHTYFTVPGYLLHTQERISVKYIGFFFFKAEHLKRSFWRGDCDFKNTSP